LLPRHLQIFTQPADEGERRHLSPHTVQDTLTPRHDLTHALADLSET
jgi:hypothetical protein